MGGVCACGVTTGQSSDKSAGFGEGWFAYQMGAAVSYLSVHVNQKAGVDSETQKAADPNRWGTVWDQGGELLS